MEAVLKAKVDTIQDSRLKAMMEEAARLLSEEGSKIENNPAHEGLHRIILDKSKITEIKLFELHESTAFQNAASEKQKEMEENAKKEVGRNVKTQLANYKMTVLENIERGYHKQNPIPMDGLFENSIKDGVNGIFDGRGAKQGLLDGLIGGIKNAILGIPMVGTFIRQVSNFIGTNVGAMFGGMFDKPVKALSWKESGDQAEATADANRAVSGLKMAGINTDVLADKLSNAVLRSNQKPTAAETSSDSNVSPEEAARRLQAAELAARAQVNGQVTNGSEAGPNGAPPAPPAPTPAVPPGEVPSATPPR